MKRSSRSAFALAAVTAAGTCLLAAPASAATTAAPAFSTTQVSLPRTQDLNGRGSNGGTMTGDGRYVLFNRQGHVYRRDLQQRVTELVSVPVPGSRRIGASTGGDISQDGRYIALVSNEPLVAGVPGDLYSHEHAYIRDMVARTTTLVDVASDGTVPQGQVDYGISISADGRRMSFATYDALVPADTNRRTGGLDTYVRDLTTRTTTLVSVTDGGAQGVPTNGNSNSFGAALSRDGRYVSFQSFANLVAEDTNTAIDLYERDLRTGLTRPVLANDAGAPLYGYYGSSAGAAVLADRKTVILNTSEALVAADKNQTSDVYAVDRATRTVTLLSRTRSGAAAGTATGSTTPDGRFLAFNSDSPDVVPDDIDNKTDGFVLEVATGTVRMVTLRADGAQFIKPGLVSSITDDGQSTTFNTIAPVSQYDHNEDFDIYLRHPA